MQPRPEPRPNRLARSSSLYLRQHAYQPVDWYPWGPEALERARRENRPILLSVGYSACHWCHVMAHESFEDPEIARWMNEHFVCIKVDREERPDVDQVYQLACQLVSGQGGWPLTAFLTPELEPFFVGTYFPPRPRFGRPGFLEVLQAIAQAWQQREAELREYAHRLSQAVRQLLRAPAAPAQTNPAADAAAGREPSARYLVWAATALLAQSDPDAGGFGHGPKFPCPTALELLLRAAWRFGHEDAATHLEMSLESMAWGGLFDHVGGGFHRYTVDRWWQVPHFEKMLYDNALLVPLYLRVGRWRRPGLTRVARRTVEFLLRDMLLPGGGFAVSLDADSPDAAGRPAEGYFYRWTPQQVEEALGDRELAAWVCQLFGIGQPAEPPGAGTDGPPGWQEEAASVVGRMPPRPPVLSEPEWDRLEQALEAMRRYRADRRQAPARDEKVVLAWHALAVSALALAAQMLEGELAHACQRAALRGWEYVQEYLMDPVRGLIHMACPDPESRVPAFCDDYGALILALLDLHRLTLEPHWLAQARELADRARHLFADDDGLYRLSSDPHHSPLVQAKDLWDQALPSPNALMALAHARLAAVLDDPSQLDACSRILRASWPAMLQQPLATAGLWCALDLADEGARVVSVLAPSVRDVEQALSRLRRLPHPALELRWQAATPPVRWVLCTGSACQPPQASVEPLLEALQPGRKDR